VNSGEGLLFCLRSRNDSSSLNGDVSSNRGQSEAIGRVLCVSGESTRDCDERWRFGCQEGPSGAKLTVEQRKGRTGLAGENSQEEAKGELSSQAS